MKLHPSHLNGRPCALMRRPMPNTHQPCLANQRPALWQQVVINAQTARLLSIEVPNALQLLADEVIE